MLSTLTLHTKGSCVLVSPTCGQEEWVPSSPWWSSGCCRTVPLEGGVWAPTRSALRGHWGARSWRWHGRSWSPASPSRSQTRSHNSWTPVKNKGYWSIYDNDLPLTGDSSDIVQYGCRSRVHYLVYYIGLAGTQLFSDSTKGNRENMSSFLLTDYFNVECVLLLLGHNNPPLWIFQYFATRGYIFVFWNIWEHSVNNTTWRFSPI